MLPGAGDKTLKRIATVRKLFLSAGKRSDYRFDRLLDLLAPDKKKGSPKKQDVAGTENGENFSDIRCN
jgi:hypothetical protein